MIFALKLFMLIFMYSIGVGIGLIVGIFIACHLGKFIEDLLHHHSQGA